MRSSARLPGCLDPEDAAALLTGTATEASADAAHEHMAGCAACRAWVSELARASWLEGTHDPASAEPPEDERYVPLVELGAGAMGTVWAAYDAKLDREVALKVLTAGASERLRVEARALASLSHPNVVEVFDVLLDASPPAIAMALVDGPTLREWLDLAQRTVKEVLVVFEQAGRGLAAAHAAGLVHRDFKPSNVIVGAGGRVQVVDFGLADDAHEGTKGFAGTPAYMAPERLRGEPATPASDQYAWCVALDEALSDDRPGHVVRALERGRRRQPEERWPSMEALLSAVTSPPPRRLRIVVVPALVFGALVVGWAFSPTRLPCTAAGAIGPATWLRAAVASSSTDEVFAQRVRAWAAADLETCETRPQLAPMVIRDRERCLDRTAHHLRLAGRALAFADPLEATAVIEQLPSPRACFLPMPGEPLSPSDTALDAEIVELEVLGRAGEYERARARAEAIRSHIEQAGPVVQSRFAYAMGVLESRAGKDGSAWLERAARAGTSGGDRRVAALAAMQLGSFTSPTVPLSEELSSTWLSRAEDIVQIERSLELRRGLARAKGNAAVYFGRYDDAITSLQHAVELGRNSRDPLTLASDLDDLAEALRTSGQLDDASHTQAKALDLLERHLGRAHPTTARAVEAMGKIWMAQGRFAEARDAYAESLALREAALGPDHIDIAVVATNLASAHIQLGDASAAIGLLRRVTQLEQALLEPGRATASTWHTLGNAHVMQDDLVQAEAAFSTGLEHMEHELGPEHPEHAIFLSSLASVALDRKQPGRAVELATRSRALRAQAFGPDDPRLAFEDLVLAGAHLDQQRPDLALFVVARGEALLTAQPVRPRWLAELRYFRARAYADLGHLARAREEAHAAASLFESLDDADVGAEIRAWTKGL